MKDLNISNKITFIDAVKKHDVIEVENLLSESDFTIELLREAVEQNLHDVLLDLFSCFRARGVALSAERTIYKLI